MCSVVWLLDPPAPSEMGQHYGEDYDRAIARAGQNPRFWAGRKDTILTYKSGGNILDLGCNSGGFLAAMKGPPWKLFGIEMSECAASEAEANCGAHVFVGDILDAPFPTESFDVITCFHVFEHLYRPREVLAKVHDWLKPGGIFYTMMPNIDSVGARIFGSYWYALELPRHLFHFSPATLRNLARSSGLEELSITTHRHLFVEDSVRYVADDIVRKFGARRPPMAQAKPASPPRRALRKGFRLAVLPALEFLAAFIGDGESIFAVFTKP
jgi:SAM-dependent methyltransferase